MLVLRYGILSITTHLLVSLFRHPRKYSRNHAVQREHRIIGYDFHLFGMMVQISKHFRLLLTFLSGLFSAAAVCFRTVMVLSSVSVFSVMLYFVICVWSSSEVQIYSHNHHLNFWLRGVLNCILAALTYLVLLEETLKFGRCFSVFRKVHYVILTYFFCRCRVTSLVSNTIRRDPYL